MAYSEDLPIRVIRSVEKGHLARSRAKKQRVAEQSDITLLELCAELAERGILTSKSAVSRFFERLGYSCLWQRIGDLTYTFSPTECQHFFQHAGYA